MKNWPLVGRDQELAFACGVLDDPDLSGIVLSGPPGVGKTRLAREVLLRASGDCQFQWIGATSSASCVPFGAAAHLGPPPITTGPGDGLVRTQLLAHTLNALMEQAAHQRLIIGVDDAHLLDDLSATLVHQLAQTCSASLVVTIRSGERVPESILALWKDGLAERTDLGPLGIDDTSTLLERVVDGQVDGATVHELWRLTRGNVLFLRELVRGGLQAGSLAPRDNVWSWEGPFTAEPRLIDIITSRMGRLDDHERDGVEMLAFGEPLAPALVAAAGRTSPLAALEAKGLLDTERAGRRVEIRLAHPLYSDVLRATTPAWRSREIQARLADGLEATGARRSGDLLRIVTWRLAAGVAMGEWPLLTAASAAIGIDPVLAESLARAALDQHRNSISGQFLLGRALAGQGRSAEAEGVFAELSNAAMEDVDRAACATARAANLFWSLGRNTEAREVLRDAEATMSRREGVGPVRALRASFELHAGNCLDALETLQDVLVHRVGHDAAQLQLLVTAGVALCMAGRGHQAVEVTTTGLELERQLDPTTGWEVLQLESSRCGALAFSGQLGEADSVANGGYRDALTRRRPLAVSMYALWLGHVARLRGDAAQSLRWLHEASLARGSEFFAPVILSNLAHAAALLGDLPAAEDAQRRAEQSLNASNTLFEVSPMLSRIWVSAARGEITRSVEQAAEAAAVAHRRGHLHFEMTALHDMVRLGAPARCVDRLASLARASEGAFAPVCAEHAAAAAAADGAALDAVANQFAVLGAMLLAAESAAQAAQAHRRAGHNASAAVSLNSGRGWTRGWTQTRSPALMLLDSDIMDVLTARQREIAGLAGAGLTSRAIADRLVVSTRTVDNALRDVYDRLGVVGRRDLQTLLSGDVADPPSTCE